MSRAFLEANCIKFAISWDDHRRQAMTYLVSTDVIVIRRSQVSRFQPSIVVDGHVTSNVTWTCYFLLVKFAKRNLRSLKMHTFSNELNFIWSRVPSGVKPMNGNFLMIRTGTSEKKLHCIWSIHCVDRANVVCVPLTPFHVLFVFNCFLSRSQMHSWIFSRRHEHCMYCT